ncbi:hypothetical protein ACHAWT_000767 [Skeletonema menzelii]
MNNEEAEQSGLIPGEEMVDGFLGGDEEGNKRKHSGDEGDAAGGEEGPEQKKRKSVGVSGCSQGVLAVKEDGKKYYQCRMSDCVKYAVQRGLCCSHGAVVKRYPKKRCVVEGCEKVARGKMFKCVAHGGTPVKKCIVEGCQNNQKQGGKCKRHGAKCTIKRCNFSKCNKFASRGGVCIRHGKELAAARAAAAAAAENAGAVAAPLPAIPPVAIAQPPAIPPIEIAPPPAIPPAAVPPLPAVNAGNVDADNAEPSPILCSEIVNDQCSAVAAVATTVVVNGNVEPPSVAAMPGAVAPVNNNVLESVNPAKKKKPKKRCVVTGCDKIGRGKSAKCVAHGGTPVKKCTFEGCQNNQKQGGRCKRHGAKLNEKPKICIFPDCKNLVRRNGVCVRHGAKIKSCSVQGCTNNAVRRTLCIKHGANSIGPYLPGAREYKIAYKHDDEPAAVV